MVKNIKKVVSYFLIFSMIFFMYMSITYAITPIADPQYAGIDVSNWQGYINYTQVKASEIEIVYIKSSEGTTYKDPYFETNYTNAKANGLKVGFYHFLTATNTTQARNQAQFFASVISGKAPDCKLAMDFEQFNGGINSAQINQIAQVFLETVQELTGKEVVIYSNLYDSKSVFSTTLANQYPLWLAYWGDYNALGSNSSNWINWIGVQYTSQGSVSGISGYVDRNRFTANILLGECTDCPTVEPPATGEEEQTTVTYTVKKGDTLWSIAKTYGTTVQSIVNTNNISNPNLIFPGQVLTIITTAGGQTGGMGSVIYTVKKGDTLWSIARTYGTTVQNIVNANNISNPNLIFPNQTLRIPLNASMSSTNTTSITYTVKRGDNLWRISRWYGVSVSYLANLNKISNPRLIYPGQVLRIR